MIESFRLPMVFEVEELRNSFLHAESKWVPHFNTTYYRGAWDGIVLRSSLGSSDTLYQKPDAEYADTELMNVYPGVRKILDELTCEKLSVRFLRLAKGALIREHSDPGLSFEDGEVRLHIPILTNSKVEFTSNGKPLTLCEGECWYINAKLSHSAANNGETDRIHLVIDCIVNDWLRSFFPGVTENPNHGLDSIKTEKDLENMIAMLKAMGTPVALELAEKYHSVK